MSLPAQQALGNKTIKEIKSGGPEHYKGKLYGGILTENIVQAIARDIMAGALVYGREYNPIITVHDEIVFEVPKKMTKKNILVFEDLLQGDAVPSYFNKDLINLEGGEALRYGK